MSILLTSLVALLGGAPVAADSDDLPWPEYRGPGHDGHAAPGTRLPLYWSEIENVTWKVPVHGRGWSSPVVGDGRIWLTTADPDGTELSVLAFDLETGETLLDRVLFEVPEPEPRHDLNSYASPSPVLAPGCVVVSFGTYGLAALDSETFEVLWTREDLRCDHIVGPGSSPLYLDGRVVLHVDGGDVQYVVAVDVKTGETVWRRPRSVDYGDLAPDLRKAYATPLPVADGDRTVLVSTAAEASYGYDAATGEELWRVRHSGFSMSSRAVQADDLVLVNTGFMRPELWAIRLGGEGDVTETHVAWKCVRGLPTMASPMLVGTRLFFVSDEGILSCLDVASGEEVWRERLEGAFSASPIHADGHVYFFDRDGVTVVLAAGDEFEQVGENLLDDGCMASPAIVGNALILRTRTHLYRIEEPD